MHSPGKPPLPHKVRASVPPLSGRQSRTQTQTQTHSAANAGNNEPSNKACCLGKTDQQNDSKNYDAVTLSQDGVNGDSNGQHIDLPMKWSDKRDFLMNKSARSLFRVVNEGEL